MEKSDLMGFEFDATECPDLFPPLVCLACNSKGKSVIRGAERLVHKESNRANALVSEFMKLGAKIKLKGNMMEIIGTGNENLLGCAVESHNDHRIAMALAVAGLNASGKTIISGEECVSKSYPDFFNDLVTIASGGVVR